MSYILDALRRAESDRGRGSVPDIHARQVPIAPNDGASATLRVPAWAWAGAALLTVLSGTVAWLLWTRDTPRDAVVVAAAGPVPSAAAVPATPAPALPPMVTERQMETAPAHAAAPVAGPALKPGARSNAREQTQPARPAPIQSDTPAPHKPVGKPEPASAPAAKASAPEPRIYTAAELPDEVRREIPALVVGGAMYSENPANRMLIVNGQLFHERDKLAPGLVLVQIRLKSAVLEYKGYRYGIAF